MTGQNIEALTGFGEIKIQPNPKLPPGEDSMSWIVAITTLIIVSALGYLVLDNINESLIKNQNNSVDLTSQTNTVPVDINAEVIPLPDVTPLPAEEQLVLPREA